MLLERADTTIEEAVTHLVGMQAQAPYAPYFGLWSRLRRSGTTSLTGALLERRVVRIALMRSTIHLVVTDDYRILRPWAQPALDRELDTAFRKALAGIDRPAVAEAGEALLGARHLTPAELGASLQERWPDREPRALAAIVRNLVPLVQVPPRGLWGIGGATRYATAADWTGVEPAAVADVGHAVLRYLAAFGPASVSDVQTWAGRTRLRPVLERLRPRLAVFRNEYGVELFDLPDAPRPDPDVAAPVRFLPEYDNVLASHADRTRVISDQFRKRVMTRNGMRATFLVDGQVAGAWKLHRAKGRATLDIDPFRPLKASERREVEDEGARLLAFAAPDARHDIEGTIRR
ncbi:winged helix DNA-binding domain-containing protein [Micromonospora sp. S4605]|uniref:winged helix DNA-binding domain-containing protein n=1 Tax=Micromonospora sp. S4605 TaxID=1420897 RepID=UPI001E5B5E45|nr:winged helix DNA-binding domain-containing protein [Micromonospora sp. S4605]